MARTIGSGGYDFLHTVPIDHSQLDMDIRPLTSELFTFESSSPPRGSNYALHELCEYGSMRYHVLITCNDGTASCVEKTLLLRCKASMSHDMDAGDRTDAVRKAWRDLEHFWHPVVKADYLSRIQHMAQEAAVPSPFAARSSQFPPRGQGKPLVRLQVVTMDGTLATKEHAETLKWPRYDPLPNAWPGLAVFDPTLVTLGQLVHGRLGNLAFVGGSRCFFKSLQGFLDAQYFIRLADNLIKLQGSPLFPVLVGLVESEGGDGRIEGILWEYIEGDYLDRTDMATKDQATREKWKRQIAEAAEITRSVGVAWSNARVSDIFIKRDVDGTENVVVWGLGCGVLHTTRAGETLKPEIGAVQGLEGIRDYIDDIKGHH